MRRLIGPCACVLALVTGVWFGQAHALYRGLAPVEVSDVAAERVATTAWRFYAAIDALLRTGDDSALSVVLAPGFVDHVDQPTDEPDREELIRYLTSLRETNRSLRVVPEEVMAQGDRAVARLSIAGESGRAILGVPLTGTAPWPRVDILRLDGDLIVERWGDPGGYVSTTALFSETLTLVQSVELVPVLQRLTYVPGATDQTFTQRGRAIIAIESGTLDVQLGPEPSAVATGHVNPTRPGRSGTIGPGETVVIPDGVAFATANRTDAPVVALLFKLIPPAPDSVRSRTDESQVGMAGITTRGLAGYTLAMTSPARVTAELVRVTLPPGARLGHHPVTTLELAVVESGTLTAAIGGELSHAWLRGTDGRSTSVGPVTAIDEGFGLTVMERAATAYDNQSPQPVTMLILRLAHSDTAATR